MRAIFTEDAPKPIGPYSQGIEVEVAPGTRIIFIAGQIPIDPRTGNIVGDDIKSQTRQVLENIRGILKAVGLGLEHVAMVFAFLKDLKLFHEFNEVYSEYFRGIMPARVVVEVSRLPRDVLVEVAAIAVASNPP